MGLVSIMSRIFTIKVITRDPVIGEFEGAFKATVSEIDDGDSSYTGDIVINAPISRHNCVMACYNCNP